MEETAEAVPAVFQLRTAMVCCVDRRHVADPVGRANDQAVVPDAAI